MLSILHGALDDLWSVTLPIMTFRQTLEEIAEMEEDIRRLEEDLRKKFWDLKLAHTRLETRTYRPNMELCRDQVL